MTITREDHDALRTGLDAVIAKGRDSRRPRRDVFGEVFKGVHDVLASFLPLVAPPTPDPVPVSIPGKVEAAVLTPLGLPAWLGQWSGDVATTVRNIIRLNVGKVPILIPYNIKGRDNGQYSAGGVGTPEQYVAWIKEIARGIGDDEAIVILEPDALGLSRSLSLEARAERYKMIQDAVHILKACKKTTVLLDASMWVEPPEMADMLGQFNGIDGFSLNVSGFEKLEDDIKWGDKVAVLSGLKYVIDTSRNGVGNPHPGKWCNVTDIRVGLAPSYDTASDYCLAYVHAKIVGESDGNDINGDGSKYRPGVPNAGDPFPEYKLAAETGDWTAFHAKWG